MCRGSIATILLVSLCLGLAAAESSSLVAAEDKTKCYQEQNNRCPEQGFYKAEMVGPFLVKCCPCPPECLSCSSFVRCTACKDGFHLRALKEVAECRPCGDTCSICSSENTCSECKMGFFLVIRRCVTLRVYYLFYIGVTVLTISTVFLTVCICMLIFPYKRKQELTLMNLFQREEN